MGALKAKSNISHPRLWLPFIGMGVLRSVTERYQSG